MTFTIGLNESPSPQRVLAIDPGTSKCGIAVVDKEHGLLFREVAASKELPATLQGLITTYTPDTVVIGNGTGSKLLSEILARIDAQITPTIVDEAHTSELARKRYLKEHPARGLERMLPGSLRTPRVPVDDYVALILAERILNL